MFHQGDESREMYVIQRGKVAIVDVSGPEEILLATRERGEFFGEMALLESLPRTATARAIGDTQVLVIRPGGFLKMIRHDPAFCFELLQSLSSRFRLINEQLVEVMKNGADDVDEIGRIITWSEYPSALKERGLEDQRH